MLILPQKVKVKWNNRVKEWYTEKGYKFTKIREIFEVNVLDLPLNSKQYVKVFCDGCNKITEKEYRVCIGKSKSNEDYCNDCKVKKRYTFEDVKIEFEKRNFTLLETEYKGWNENYKYICNNGHETKITFQNLMQGNGCKKCASLKLANERKRSIEEVKRIFQENNCTLLTEDYINSFQKLDYICECGNTSETTLNRFLQGKRCKKCGIKKCREARLKYNIDNVKNIFGENGCILLENKYIDFNTPMRFICTCGNESKKSLNKFLKHPQCKKCSFDNLKGENSPRWNPNLTNEEREKGRKIEGYEEWRKEVFERDDYICQCCHEKDGTLNAHHLDGYNWCKEKRTNVDNGITLCEDCHKNFHSEYGIKNNTKEQFEEWIKNKLI